MVKTRATTANLQPPQPLVTTESSRSSTKGASYFPCTNSTPGNSGAMQKRKIDNEAFSRPSSGDRDEAPSTKKIIIMKEPGVATTSSSASDKGQHATKKVGEYILGPKIGTSPVNSIQPYLARKDGTDEFYIIKVLTLKDANEKETMDDIQGKTLLHTEYFLSSLLKYETGIVHEHSIIKSKMDESIVNDDGQAVTKEVNVLCLVLDCYMPHDFSPEYSHITNMQYYVISAKKLPEAEAIRIFYKVLQIVDRMHKVNIVHRDLKLGSIILNKKTGKVTLANLCLGKHLTSDNDLLKDQRGSPAHISPEIIIGKPYLGKPSDMWSLGIVLYTMLYGQFPFYDQSPTELFRKIKRGEFQIPLDVNVSKQTVEVIQSLLVLDPKKRPTAEQVLKDVKSIIKVEETMMGDSDLQVVPDCHPGAERSRKRTYADRSDVSDTSVINVASILVKAASETDSSESDDFEPFTKIAKRIVEVQIPGIHTKLTLDELRRIHELYVARKLKEAAIAKLPLTLAPEVVTSHFTSSSSGGFTKSTASDLDSAVVPDSYDPSRNNVEAKNPTLESGA